MFRQVRVPALFLAFAAMALVSCGRAEPGPERTVRRFFRAMNEKDVNRLLSCVDPRQERIFKATFRLIEKATGFPVDDLFEILPGLHEAFGDRVPEDFRFAQVRVRSREVSGTTARLRVSVKTTYRSGSLISTQTEELEFALEHFEEAGWRIIGVTRRAATFRASRAPENA